MVRWRLYSISSVNIVYCIRFDYIAFVHELDLLLVFLLPVVSQNTIPPISQNQVLLSLLPHIPSVVLIEVAHPAQNFIEYPTPLDTASSHASKRNNLDNRTAVINILSICRLPVSEIKKSRPFKYRNDKAKVRFPYYFIARRYHKGCRKVNTFLWLVWLFFIVGEASLEQQSCKPLLWGCR